MASAHPSGQQPHLHADTSRADTLTSRVVDSQSAETPATFVSPPSDLLTVIGRDACFKRLSPTFPPAFGYREADLLDRPFIGFIHPADRAATSAALDKLAQGEPTLGLENRFRCKDGAHRRLTWTALPTPEGLLYAVARDITERRQRQGDPAQSPAGEQAGAVTENEESVAAVCHDLQQPLTVILAHAQLLQRQLARSEPVTSERLGNRLAHILAAAARMRGMTQDLVDASIQQSGRPLARLLAKTELVALTRSTVLEHQLVSDRHQFVFEAEMHSLVVSVDEARAHRVLANLLTNAVKYSPAGGPVRVSIKAGNSSETKSAVLVVRDEGMGIPRADLPHVFDRFHRGSNVIGHFAGSGLGLASARGLVELYGGTISVESEEGKGTTFVVCLPLATPSDVPS